MTLYFTVRFWSNRCQKSSQLGGRQKPLKKPRFMGSDNQAGAHPAILEALALASDGLASAYGEDSLSETLNARGQ